MALINIHPFRKKKTPEELEEERRLKEEETKAAFAGGGEGIIEQSELPGKEEGPRKISLEEKKRLLQQNPGSAVDEFGKVSPPLTDRFGNKTAEGKERIFGTQELAAGAGIPTREIEKQAREKAVREQRLLGIMEKAQAGLATAEELAEVEGSDINLKEVAGAAALASVPGAIAGATSGATLGAGAGLLGGPLAPVTSTAGALTLGLIGAIGTGAITAYRAAMSNIKSQQAGEFAADKDALRNVKTALTMLITETNAYPERAEDNYEQFLVILDGAQMAHAKTKADSDENLNIFQGQDGTPELAKFDNFNEFLRPVLIQRMNNAMFNPDPSKVAFTEAEIAYINSFGEES
jgi:hypothetical protein